MELEQIIDVRDLTQKFEELEANEERTEEENEEFAQLKEVLEELCGNGGDEQWRGDWYPLTLIRDDHFTDSMFELLEDCGTLPRDLPGWVVIDRDATAENMKADYTGIEISDTTYWYR